MNVFRLSKPYVTADFHLTSAELKVRKKCYPLHSVKRVELRKLGLKDNIINVMSLALVLSAATWAFVPGFGLPVFMLTFFIGFMACKKYKLRAEYCGTDEAGDYWVPFASCNSEVEFEVLKDIHMKLLTKIE